MIRRKINILIEEGSGRGNESQIPLAVRDRTVNTQHTNIHTHTYKHACKHIHTNIHSHMQTYIHAHIHTYIHGFMNAGRN